jgi:hypothetical protein
MEGQNYTLNSRKDYDLRRGWQAGGLEPI